MEHYKISNLLNVSAVSKCVTGRWIEVNYLWRGQYSVNKNVRFKSSILRWDLCDYSDVYVVVKWTVDLFAAAANSNDKVEKNVALRNNVSFNKCISKNNSALIDNVENLDIVIPMYNLLEYGQNYFITSGSLR